MNHAFMSRASRELSSLNSKPISIAIGLFISIYFIFYVLVPDGYSIGPAFLFILSVIYFRWSAIRGTLETEDWWFLSAFIVYFLGYTLLNLIHGESVDHFDRPSRFLIAVFIFTLLARATPRPNWFWFSAALGSLASGLFAIHATAIAGMSRATSHDNAIYFGNGSLVLGLLSFSGFVWFFRRDRYSPVFAYLFLVAAVFGLIACFLSGTRGGWLALPFLVLIFVTCFREMFESRGRYLATILVSILLIGSGFLAIDSVQERIEKAATEISNYFEKGDAESSIGRRLEMYRAGWILFLENPWAGTSESGFDAARQGLVDEGVAASSITDYRHFHNQFIDNAAKGGMIGLLAVLYLFSTLVVCYVRKTFSRNPDVRILAVTGLTFVVAYIVFCMTQGMLVRHMGVMMFILVPVLTWVMIRGIESRG